MQDEKTEAAATPDKSPAGDNFQTRFAAQLEKWREQGCAIGPEGGLELCGARPHRTKISPADADGNVTMHVDCSNGHEDVWQFKVAEAEMKAELMRQAEAAKVAEANGGKSLNPMVAKVTISLDLRTQELKIEPWVPTPGMGIQLAGMLMSHFFAQLQQMAGGQSNGPKIKLPPKGILHPKTGRLVS